MDRDDGLKRAMTSKPVSIRLGLLGKMIHVHRELLSNVSPWFNASIGAMTTSGDETLDLALNEAQATAFGRVIEYLYTGSLECVAEIASPSRRCKAWFDIFLVAEMFDFAEIKTRSFREFEKGAANSSLDSKTILYVVDGAYTSPSTSNGLETPEYSDASDSNSDGESDQFMTIYERKTPKSAEKRKLQKMAAALTWREIGTLYESRDFLGRCVKYPLFVADLAACVQHQSLSKVAMKAEKSIKRSNSVKSLSTVAEKLTLTEAGIMKPEDDLW